MRGLAPRSPSVASFVGSIRLAIFDALSVCAAATGKASRSSEHIGMGAKLWRDLVQFLVGFNGIADFNPALRRLQMQVIGMSQFLDLGVHRGSLVTTTVAASQKWKMVGN